MNRYLIVQDHGCDGDYNAGVVDAETIEEAYAAAKEQKLVNEYCATIVYDVMTMFTYHRDIHSFLDGGVVFERGA